LFHELTHDRHPDGTFPQVDAAMNWWGGDVESFVAGRIWERRDDDNLIEVAYNPFYKTNASVLSGMLHVCLSRMKI
jgi:hypothetical protein